MINVMDKNYFVNKVITLIWLNGHAVMQTVKPQDRKTTSVHTLWGNLYCYLAFESLLRTWIKESSSSANARDNPCPVLTR